MLLPSATRSELEDVRALLRITSRRYVVSDVKELTTPHQQGLWLAGSGITGDIDVPFISRDCANQTPRAYSVCFGMLSRQRKTLS